MDPASSLTPVQQQEMQMELHRIRRAHTTCALGILAELEETQKAWRSLCFEESPRHQLPWVDIKKLKAVSEDRQGGAK